jgi:hypothetical protein
VAGPLTVVVRAGGRGEVLRGLWWLCLVALMGWGIAAASRMGDIDAEVTWNEEGFVTWQGTPAAELERMIGGEGDDFGWHSDGSYVM